MSKKILKRLKDNLAVSLNHFSPQKIDYQYSKNHKKNNDI